MAVTHSDFLDYAGSEISKSTPSEIQLRNAASRAYYALYHRAKSRLTELGKTPITVQNSGSHAAVIEGIRRYSQKGRRIAEQMEKLKKFRHACDYQLTFTVPPLKVAQQVREAERLIGMLERIEQEP